VAVEEWHPCVIYRKTGSRLTLKELGAEKFVRLSLNHGDIPSPAKKSKAARLRVSAWSHNDLKPFNFVSLGEVAAGLIRNQEQMHRERAQLGACMTYPTATEAALTVLEAVHFSEPVHAAIWNAATNLVAEGRPVNPLTLGRSSEKRKSHPI
jgi:hypothetical protein